jgi:hypothetical protein
MDFLKKYFCKLFDLLLPFNHVQALLDEDDHTKLRRMEEYASVVSKYK